MTRFVSVAVLVIVLLAGGSVASAQDSTLGGATIGFSELRIHEKNNPELQIPAVDPTSKWLYFNLAHCQCGAPGINQRGTDYHETEFSYLLTVMNAPMATISRSADVWVGAQCSDLLQRPQNCRKVGTVGSVETIRSMMNVRATVKVFDLMTPAPKSGSDAATVDDCATTQTAEQMDSIWIIVDGDGNGVDDYFSPQAVTVDIGPPTLPTNFTARGGESSIELAWTPPSDASDTYGYQALCSKATDNSQGKTSGQPSAKYTTAAALCGATDARTAVDIAEVAIPPPPSDVDAGEPLPATLTGGLKDLNPAFLCGEEISTTATGLKIEGLENDVPYNVVLLALDKFGNARGAFFTSTVTPIPSVDFWEDSQGRHSKVDGGLCLLAETYGDDSSLTGALRAFRDETLGGSWAGRRLSAAYYATLGKLGSYVHGSLAARVTAGVILAPVVALALAWHWLTLPGLLGLIAVIWLWRRRGFALPRWVRTAAPMALVLALAGRAHAGGYQPYWENSNIPDEQTQVAPDDPSLVTWLVGFRVGPYTPQIDRHYASKPGPYEQMFGGYHMMAMLDVDRVLWTGFGQVAVGVSLGYLQKTARAFTIDSMPSDPDRARASDENKFALIPTALTATYRFTMLDDDYGIPVVPYVRAGLAYYVWWVSDSNGISTVCKDGSNKANNPSCDKDQALGGSLGFQGSIGLAIRAERIDASAANSMRQSGIQHAGIYGELSLAKVDGFGSEKKLSVGDATWFAGVHFEF